MYETIVLAAALQRWDWYSAHALAARSVAGLLARQTSKSIHVLSVYEYAGIPRTVSGELGARYCEREIKAWMDQAQDEEIRRTDALMLQKMSEYIAPLEARGLTVSTILRVGNPRVVIVEVARSLAADVLVIGSHSQRSLFDVALGGTAQQVIRHAPCPVLLVSPAQDQHRREAENAATLTASEETGDR